jgi:GT2 family glycosyltransferase
MSDAPPTVAVIILNWNRADLTIRCLETVLALDYPEFDVVVVDNGSKDGSIQELRAWALGQGLELDVRGARALPPVHRPPSGPRTRFTLIQADSNRGYGGGNNLGILYALRRGYDACWILNNDTTVECHSLGRLMRELMADPRVGIVGACVLEADDSETIQCVGGGLYDRWTSRVRLIGQGGPASDASRSYPSPDFISGASMLLAAASLRAVGGLEEGYFLYCEEIDLAWRLRRAGWSMRVAPDAVVRHSMGSSAGSHSVREHRSASSMFYSARSSVLLARKFHRLAVPTVALARLALAVSMAIKGERQRASSVARGAVAGLSASGWSHVPAVTPAE